MTLIGVFAVAAALVLLASGPAKLRAPDPTAAALRALGGPRTLRRRSVVRVGGLAEVAIALAVLLGAGRVAGALLAVAYLAFTVVALRLVLTRAEIDCGCFGAASAPVGRAHLVLTAAGTTVGVLASFRPTAGVRALFDHGAAAGVAAALLAVVLAGTAGLAVTALPVLARTRREVIP